ncbi:MAG: 4-hydroxy-tetrahydrodipicolinate reductase [Sphaerochaetaceae bacterium]|nr:4-hydroxy-tetrahydrodipicolinate reductase [Sphaerochaetaceae bacterium]
MRIAVVGYGRMGHVVTEMALRGGDEVVAVIDPEKRDERVTATQVSLDALKGAEVVIEFSVPEGIEQRIAMYCEAQIPCVIATTGWYDRIEKIRKTFDQTGNGLIWSGNFAIGVHVFFQIIRSATHLINRFSDYDPVVQELFHAGKADSPSGTSLMLGKILLEELDAKSTLESARLDRRRSNDEIHLSSARGGYHPGTHTVIFDSAVDSIEITHRARSREGFASGALLAARWMNSGRKGFFTLDDMITQITGQG